jgi:replicative DNA helicase
VAGFLDAEHFYEPLHAEIYRIIRRLAHEGRIFNPITLAPFFTDAEPVGGLNVAQYMGKLAASVTSLMHVHEFGRTIEDLYRRRQFADNGLRQQQLAGDLGVSVAQAAAESVQELDTIIAASRPNQLAWMTAEACAQKLLHDLENGLTGKLIPSGLTDYDRVTGGHRRGELDGLASRPSMGKSTLAISMALPPAQSGHGVLLFSLEMTKGVVAARCLSNLVWNRDTPIEYADILKGRVSMAHDKERLQRATRQLAGLPLIVDDQAL